LERALKMRRALDAHDLKQLLKDWIIEHILKEDRSLPSICAGWAGAG
jgi:hemerythrin